MGVHPALACSILFRFVPSELPALRLALRVGIPLAKDESLVDAPFLANGAVNSDELGDLGISFRRALVGVEGPVAAAVGAEGAGGLLIRPLPVFTGVPEVIVDFPRLCTRRDRVVASADAGVGALGAPSVSPLFKVSCTWLRLLR